MPKKLRLDIDALKVQSFVTSLPDKDKSKIKGGDEVTKLPGGTCTCDTMCLTVCQGTCDLKCLITMADTCDVGCISEPAVICSCELCSPDPGCTLNPDLCPTVAC